MKVFKMNDFDWVYAENEKQAKEYYVDLTDCDLDDIEDIKEVSMQDTMLYEVSKLPIEEQKMVQKMSWFGGELCAYKPFEWVIKQEGIEAPCIIASTEC
jgi:hypothetical protein